MRGSEVQILSPAPFGQVENSSGTLFPLVFKVANGAALGLAAVAPAPAAAIPVRTIARSLDGMQKEAIVTYGPTGTSWRLVCDEGPYLNGTDLAPFPLSFFAAGLAASIMSEVLALLRARAIGFGHIELVLDNRYSMVGSALKGTMTGDALPVELWLNIDSDADDVAIDALLLDAVASSPACGLLRDVLGNGFSISHNGHPISCGRVRAADCDGVAVPDQFEQVRPGPAASFAPGCIEKLEAAATVFGVEGGAGSSLQDEQKRTLHVRGVCTLREDGLKAIKVQLLKPIGSVFRFLADDSAAVGGRERAPPGLALLSAGIAFCYMTQLGRYAHIVKKPLAGYRIVQDTAFSLPGASGGTGAAGSAAPIATHVFVDTAESDDYARELVDMGEQTCFLHAACRTSVELKPAQAP